MQGVRLKKLPLGEFTSAAYALIVDDGGAFVDRRKARESLESQLQMHTARWERVMLVMFQSSATIDSWGTSKQAEMAQKGLMMRLGGPAPLRKSKAGEKPRQ